MAMEIKLWNGWYHTWLVITTLGAKTFLWLPHTHLQVRGQKNPTFIDLTHFRCKNIFVAAAILLFSPSAWTFIDLTPFA